MRLKLFTSAGWRRARGDKSTDSLQTIDYAHHEIHAGSHYYVSGHSALDATDTVEFIVVTPDTTTWAHMYFVYSGNKGFHVDVYEGATFTAATGTLATPRNNNRNEADASILEVRLDPSGIATDAATLIDQQKIGPASPGKSDIGGSVGREDELILKQNETYLFRVTSDENSNIVNYKGFWYEHQDKA